MMLLRAGIFRIERWHGFLEKLFLVLLVGSFVMETFGQSKVYPTTATEISNDDRVDTPTGCGILNLGPCYGSTVKNVTNTLSGNDQFSILYASPGGILGLGSYEAEIELDFGTNLPANIWSYVRLDGDSDLFGSLLGGSLGEVLSDVLGTILFGRQGIRIQALNSLNSVVLTRTSTEGFDTARVRLTMDGEGNYYLAIKPDETYRKLRIRNRSISALGLGAEYSLQVHHAFYFNGIDPCGPMPAFTSYDGDGISLDLLNLNELVLNPSHAIDNNPTSYSQISLGVLGVAATTEQFIYFTSPVLPGNDILVSLATSSSLVDLGLLNYVDLVAYSNGIEVESVAASSLLELDLLGLLDTDSFIQFPINHESAPIDQIGIRISSLADVGLLAGGLQVGAVTVAPSSPGFEEDHETGLYIICQGDDEVIKPDNERGRVLNWYNDYEGEDPIGQSNEYDLQDLAPGDYNFYVRSEYQSCSGEGLPSIFKVTVNPQPQEDDISIDPQGGVLGQGNKISYPVGSDVVIDPNIAAPFLGTGIFTWYKEGIPLDGLETDGGTFEVDEDGRLTISNTTAAVEGYELLLEYESPSGCKTVKQFSLENFIILPSLVHTFDVQAKEWRQVGLVWELSNEQLEGSVMIQRASSNLEFAAIGSLPIATDMEKIRMEFTDQHPLPGRNYYRLFITKESEGSSFYSEVRMAEIDSFDLPAFVVFPNSFEENFTVESTIDLDVPVVASLLNTNGAVIRQVRMDRLSYAELIEFRDLRNLPEGIYILRMETARGSKAYRVIKQNGG